MTDTSFLGFIEGSVLFVDQVFNGSIVVGLQLYGPGVLSGTIVTEFGTGSGAAGTYLVNQSQTAAGPKLFQNIVPTPSSAAAVLAESTSAAVDRPSGPDYPRVNFVPGENAIGKFKIGVSQIGDVPLFDLWSTVLSQYANSPTLMGMLESLDGAIDQTANFNAFFDDVWNVDSAWGYGLDVWGRIVGIARVLQVENQPIFGFAEAAAAGNTLVVGFGQGMFYAGVVPTSNYALDDESFRRLILAKAASNICDDSIQSINKILLMLFPYRGNCWVSDNPTPQYFGFAETGVGGGALGFNQGEFYTGETLPRMTMTYNFAFELSPIDLAIVNSGVLPKPVGVTALFNIF